MRRLRRRQRRQLAAAVAVLGAWAAVNNSHTPAPVTGVLTRAPVAAAPAPAGSTYTPSSWAAALLSTAGLPQTRCNVAAVTAWEQAEGGNWANAARFNPLNTTQPEPGSQPMNSASVQAYPSWQTGLTATVATLGNGRYGPILTALKNGGDAQVVAAAVASSPWGTGAFTAAC